MPRRTIFWLAVVAAFGLAPAALGAEPTLADKETARSLFYEGDEEYREGRYEAALEAFRAADEIMGVPTTGLEVGRTLMKLDRLLEATETLRRVSKIPETEGEDPVQTEARREAVELLEAVREKVPSIQVKVKGPDDGTPREVSVDGAPIPASAQRFPRKVDPGEHVVRVEAPGFHPDERTVSIEAYEHRELVVALEPIEREEGGKLWGYPIWGWAGFAVGAAGAIVGTTTGVVSLDKESALSERCDGTVCEEAERDDIDEALAIAHASTGAFVVAGVGVAVGGAGIVFETFFASTRGEEVAVEPRIGPGYLGLRGRF